MLVAGVPGVCFTGTRWCSRRDARFRERYARLAMTRAASGSGLEWLLSFSDPRRGVGWNTGSRGGLEANLRRTRVLLDLVGSPDREMFVVLVAGTKGKG